MKVYIKNSIVGLSLIVIFLLGYLRELVFLSINAVINKTPFPYTRAYIKPPAFLYELSSSDLSYLKWGLTFCFSLFFCGATLALVHFYFKSKSFNRLTIITYIVLFIASLIAWVLGIIFNHIELFYTISRFLAGLLQYPLLTLVIFSLFYFINLRTNE